MTNVLLPTLMVVGLSLLWVAYVAIGRRLALKHIQQIRKRAARKLAGNTKLVFKDSAATLVPRFPPGTAGYDEALMDEIMRQARAWVLLWPFHWETDSFERAVDNRVREPDSSKLDPALVAKLEQEIYGKASGEHS